MQDIVALFVIILISYIIVSYLFDNKKEHYITSIVGANNIAIPAYYIPSVFESETKELVKLFKDTFSDDNVEPIGFKEVELPNGDIDMVPYYTEDEADEDKSI